MVTYGYRRRLSGGHMMSEYFRSASNPLDPDKSDPNDLTSLQYQWPNLPV